MNYPETIQYLYDCLPVFHHVGGEAYKPGLDNTICLMSALKNPQNGFRSIHIAGTNGKGSVSNFLAAVLQKAGYKTGLYTSPHLVDFRERIRVNGEMIDKHYVVNFVEQHKELINEINPSFFEATMAMAFNYFADCKVDIAIIEVGLGGRLDSTNIIQPELSVITNISYDHVGFLGNTLEKIAFEKAGIIKSKTPVIIGETLPETRPVFETKAKIENAPVYYAEDLIKVKFIEFKNNKMRVETSDNKSFTIGLCGLYQLKNIATTLTAVKQLKALNYDITDAHLREGLENVSEITGLQGRWQIVQQKPLVIADIAHNPAGIQFVTKQLRAQPYHHLRIIFGVVNDKDISAMLPFLPKNARYYFTQANIERALSVEPLHQKAQSNHLKGDAYLSVKQAVESAFKESLPDDCILITGSNYVVGEALEFINTKNQII
jgi:dihydrofolate synthase/folylpolyglutamate synthase